MLMLVPLRVRPYVPCQYFLGHSRGQGIEVRASMSGGRPNIVADASACLMVCRRSETIPSYCQLRSALCPLLLSFHWVCHLRITITLADTMAQSKLAIEACMKLNNY